MFKEIKIGERIVPMLCKASTNVYYKQIFGKDPILLQADGNMTAGEQVIFAQQLAFVMAKAAECNGDRSKMTCLSEDDYLEWLDDLEFMDLQAALQDVMSLYAASGKSTTSGKSSSAR